MNTPALSPATVQVFGIPNCDTVKKARAWLTAQGIEITFHDFKKQGLTGDRVTQWLQQVDWAVLINRKGTTWRQLSDEEKAAITDADSAQKLAIRLPSVIKRPVVVWANGDVTVGFDPADWSNRV
mgnify:FL=1|jgi:arsenate reductase